MFEAKITEIINGKGSTLRAKAKLIAMGIKIITVALLVIRLVNIVIIINRKASIKLKDCP